MKQGGEKYALLFPAAHPLSILFSVLTFILTMSPGTLLQPNKKKMSPGTATL